MNRIVSSQMKTYQTNRSCEECIVWYDGTPDADTPLFTVFLRVHAARRGRPPDDVNNEVGNIGALEPVHLPVDV